MKVLLVDDNPTNLQLLFSTLKGLGHKLLVAKSGEDALKVAQWALPDLILLDILMAGIDGFDTCERLKENPLTRDIAVIFLSALDDTDDKIKGLSLGAVDYIAKPFDHDELVMLVDRVLREKQKERRAAALQSDVDQSFPVAGMIGYWFFRLENSIQRGPPGRRDESASFLRSPGFKDK